MPKPSHRIERVLGAGWEYRLIGLDNLPDGGDRVYSAHIEQRKREPAPTTSVAAERNYFHVLANWPTQAVTDLRVQRRFIAKWMVQSFGSTKVAIATDLPPWEDVTPSSAGVDLWPYVTRRGQEPGYDVHLGIEPGVPYLREP